ncbi:formylglycine-generating enzyme family protein [Polycladidibacter stylochi]|uniref:formylglycine-generating enzyme family protein n=1 Tax=Polycladidibacter stylochi TaxID=1807766 RepID=UPI0009E7111C|nr:SUMF1/EgtB/PvdO family nonheme iron enzyme [Pseudovibrio stylochi]
MGFRRAVDHLKTSFLLILGGVVVGGVGGGAVVAYMNWSAQGDPSLIPQMAEHPVVFPNGHRLYVQKYEVSVAEWNRCHTAGACTLKLRVSGKKDSARIPATGLNFEDVSQYVDWMNAHSGHQFRLPTQDEWNFMAAKVLPKKPEPIFKDPSLTWASAYLTEGLAPRRLKARGSFSTSAEGVADLDGSVWEWTGDCYSENGEKIEDASCPAFYVSGEHMAVIPYPVRDPARGGCAVGTPPAHLGFRLVSDTAVDVANL